MMTAAPHLPHPRTIPRDASDVGLVNLLDGHYTPLGYRAARVLVQDGVTAESGSGDYHAAYDRRELIDQSRQFRRDNGLYKGLIDRAVTNIVGPGFALQVQTKSRAWNNRAEALWREFSATPEVRGLWSWRQVQQMVLREVLVCGDVGAIKVGQGPKRGRVQITEAERIAKEYGDTGIRLDAEGQPEVFYVAHYGSGGQIEAADAEEYAAKDFIFVPLLDRPSQTRGTPPCQASFAMLHRIADVCDAEALAMQILARLAVAVTKEDVQEWAQATSKDDPDQASSEEEGDFSTRLHELKYGLIFFGKPGEEVKGIERTIPGKNFETSIRTFLRLLGLPLGLPLEIVFLDWSQSNYSSARASLEQAFAVFTDHQRLLEERFHNPIYRWKIDQWIDAHKLRPRADKYAHSWIRPSYPWIDQLKECQAWGAKLDRGLVTYGQACKSLNSDREEVVEQREREVRAAIETADRIMADHPAAEIPWEIFAGLRPPRAREGHAGGEPPTRPKAIPGEDE